MSVRDDSYAAYDAMQGYRSGHLRLLWKHAPLHLRYHLDNPQDSDTGSRKALRAIHCAILEGPDVLRQNFVVYDDRRGTKAHKAFMADHPGQTDLKQAEWDTAETIARTLHTHPVTRHLFPGPGEVAVQWTDKASGLLCKALLDMPRADGGMIWDVKTVNSIAEHNVMRLMTANAWELQLAHHLDGAIAKGIVPPDSSAGLLLVEQAAPHDLALQPLTNLALNQARRDRATLLATLAECERTNTWPGRYPGPVPIDLPLWRYDEPEEMDEDIHTTEEPIP